MSTLSPDPLLSNMLLFLVWPGHTYFPGQLKSEAWSPSYKTQLLYIHHGSQINRKQKDGKNDIFTD